jgi:hypothetical protein
VALETTHIASLAIYGRFNCLKGKITSELSSKAIFVRIYNLSKDEKTALI